MKHIELTSKLVLIIIGLTSVSAILVPTYAVPSIKSADIVNESILSEDIKNGEVKTVDLASDAVTLVVTERISDVVIVPPGEQAAAAVECNDDEVVTGGGFSLSIGSDTVPRSSAPFENGWEAQARNPSTATEDGNLVAVVECAKLVP